EQSLRKGHQVFLEGRLVLETWDDKQSGQKRSKHVVVLDNFQFLEPRADNAGGEGAGRYQRPSAPPAREPAGAPAPAHDYDEPSEPEPMEPAGRGEEGEIPF